jgi:predicted N-acetyltransferase YhbS
MVNDGLMIKDLGDGLVLRHATPQDADALAAFNARMHSDDGPEQPDGHVEDWVRDLLERPHPTFAPRDFMFVENTANRQIVSCLCLISQTWSYDGIPFGVGRPELIATHPDYRKRGLVRIQMDVAHQWSAERGERMQIITGIPYFYRQFGYEMALELDSGRIGYLANISQLADGQGEPYRIRPVRDADLPFIAGLYENSQRRYLVNCIRDEQVWRYELSGKREGNDSHLEWRIIETPDNQAVGCLAHPIFNWEKGSMLPVWFIEIVQGCSWAAIMPTALRYLEAVGKTNALKENKKPFGELAFWLSQNHPVYEVLQDRLPGRHRPYSYYVRVPDLPGFLRLIAPTLEQRLTKSAFAGHSGELKITFYRSGLKMSFEKGRLSGVQPWNPEPQSISGEAGFPDLTFLQLVFCYRTLDELRFAFPDCWWENDDTYGLLNALFPKQPSAVWCLS